MRVVSTFRSEARREVLIHLLFRKSPPVTWLRKHPLFSFLIVHK